MSTESSQTNTDTNTNSGGYVGEVEASLGGLDFSGMGASTSSATSSSNVDFGGFGDINIASGKGSAGSFGTVKATAFIILALVGFVVYQYVAKGAK